MSKFKLENIEGYVANHLRLFISLTFGVALVAGLIAALVFFIAVRGAEQTMVPDVRTKELTEALLELQAKELYPRIQLRRSQSARDRGTILEQDPIPGTIVKAGRRIRLVVSQGVTVSALENYRGRNIEEVRSDIVALFASSPQALIVLKEPFMYEYSSQPAGTILEQSPEPGTSISGPLEVEFVVSRGPRNATVTTPNLLGLTAGEALEKIRGLNLKVNFSLRPPLENEKGGTVAAQEPPEETAVPIGGSVRLTVAEPATLGANEIFGLFTYFLPENPYPMPVKLEVTPPDSGDRYAIAALESDGGTLAIPYQVETGSTLILSMLGREIYRGAAEPIPAQNLEEEADG